MLTVNFLTYQKGKLTQKSGQELMRPALNKLMTLSKGEIIIGDIDAIGFGGQGILRHKGQVVFVPFTALKDKVSVEILEDKKTYAKARLIEIISPSPHRNTPPCPYFGVCGGCQLQHLSYQQQLLIKHRFVHDAIVRIGQMDNVTVLPVIGADEVLGYRRHIRLHAEVTPTAVHLGYVTEDKKSIIDISRCPIFDETETALFDDLRAISRQLCGLRSTTFDISLFKAPLGYVALFDVLEELKRSITIQTALNNFPRITGLIVRNSREEHALGDGELSFELDGLKLCYSPLAFVQAHPEQSRRLYLELKNRMAAVSVTSVLDLYCGIGATSLLLAREGMRVCGIEGNSEAIRLAHANARANGLDVTFMLGDVDKIALTALRTHKPQAVVVNPPRTGLSKKILDILLTQKLPTIFYISCMPATLARDLKAFSQAGYLINYCQPFDMFPQTTHVETLVHLQRSNAA